MATAFARSKVSSITCMDRSAVLPKAVSRSINAPRVVASAAFSVKASSAAPSRARVAAGVRHAVSRRSTVVTQAKIGDSLGEFLAVATKDVKLRVVLSTLADASRTIAHKVATASCAGTACVNSFGDEQLAIDMLADKILFDSLKHSHVVSYACSEEVPEPVAMGGEGFSVAFDPLDGSSIVDTNFAVGTIFGIWPGDKLVGITGREQAAAGMTQYGPRTVYVIALAEYPGCHEFLLQDDGSWLHVKETSEIGERLRASSSPPGNLRAIKDNPEYSKLIDFYLENQYTLRYTGGMVPDVFQILVKEKGVFTNVTSPTTKAKLRILFEVAPIGLLVEKAGGHSSADGKQISALDVPITAYDQRTQICYGSLAEVRRFEEYMFGSAPRFPVAAK
ncbi:MAG: hypothetical protein WDW38_001357 [Sanguina aurantia]